MAEELERTPNWPYLLGLGFNIWLCCWQAGFSQGGNNVSGDYIKLQLNWTDSEAEFNNSAIAFVEAFGITAGSFLANAVVAYGRRKTIIICNVILIAFTALTLIQNFWCIIIGKLIMSICAGTILIAANLILEETVPRQLHSLFGNLINFGIITAIFMELSIGLVFPDIDEEPEKAKTTQLWRLAYGAGIPPACLSLLMWFCCQRWETPQYIVDKGRNEEALVHLKMIYKLKHPRGYQTILNELEEVAQATQDQHPEDHEDEVGQGN